MTTTFFIADTHFGHKNIITFDATKPHRPFKTIEEHDEEIIRRWNKTVGTRDIVFHLGDFCFGRRNLPIAGRLNGDKRLVMGNHDHYPTSEYLKFFTKVFGAVEYKDMILTHIPVHPDQLKTRYKRNIHGHLHTVVVKEWVWHGAYQYEEIDKKYINVSCEQINLTPIAYDTLVKRF